MLSKIQRSLKYFRSNKAKIHLEGSIRQLSGVTFPDGGERQYHVFIACKGEMYKPNSKGHPTVSKYNTTENVDGVTCKHCLKSIRGKLWTGN